MAPCTPSSSTDATTPAGAPDSEACGGQPGCSGSSGRYDAYYARSTDSGASFSNHKIPMPEGQPALCGDLQAGHTPGDYPGMAVANSRVWMAFAGTSCSDPNSNQTVLWVSRVDL